LLFVLCYLLWAHKTSLAPPFFIEVSVPSPESGWLCICVILHLLVGFY